mgnify:FL=1
MSELKDRLRELRKSTGLSQTDFALKLGCGRGSIKNLEEGKTDMTPAFADLICRTYGCDRIWLETGEGEMFREMSVDEQIADFVGGILSDRGDQFQKKVIQILSSLDDEGWKALNDFLDAIDRAKNKEP